MTPEDLRAICESITKDGFDPGEVAGWLREAEAALTAAQQCIAELEAELAGVRAGTHWVAPWKSTPAMDAAGLEKLTTRHKYIAMRDAYLAEQGVPPFPEGINLNEHSRSK